jgi:hypothetical protein
MLKVYVDDNDVGVAPVSVLAGWTSDGATWTRFEKEWSGATRHFPETDANGRSGEFAG